MKAKKVLIANRGEIAIRIARTCKLLGFKTVAVFSNADRTSDHVKMCDEAVWVGDSQPKESYLDYKKIIEAAKRVNVHYIHPGYGFLSESAEFVRACNEAKITFIGPSAENIDLMGDKIRARETVDTIGVPRVPGSKGVLTSPEEVKKIAEDVGYPVLLKAKAGGGGKGMRLVESEKEISSSFDAAKREAEGAFGDSSLYIEKFIVNPHHVEIQVFGDGNGNAIHLGERECSIQRRHQKIWEESPAPVLRKFSDTKQKMCDAAVKIASKISYAGAGTVEFIVDESGSFYFLEMNTRLQVEHPVTEWVTGVDLVAWQIQLADKKFTLPNKVDFRGHAIEVRLYAEDPERFLPAAGPIGLIDIPCGPFIRWDSSYRQSGEVSVFYDPMIAKLSVWGQSRDEALSRMRVALDELRIEPPLNSKGDKVGGLKTNLTFLRELIKNNNVIKGETTTNLIQKNPDLTTQNNYKLTEKEAIALSLYEILSETNTEEKRNNSLTRWGVTGLQERILR